MRTELVTTLKRQATDLLADVERDREPILITQHGLPSAYLVDVETYETLLSRMAMLEGIARGDAKTSRLVGRKVEDIKLPKGARIGAIVRGEGRKGEVLMPHHDTVIEADDHIVIFIPNKRLVREVEKLFQVTATFFG